MGTQVSIEQAAVTLKVSEKTIRRRLKNGQLAGHKVDGKWTVDLPDDHSGQFGQFGQYDQVTIEMLRAEITALTNERDWLRRHAEQLTALNAGLTSTIHNMEHHLLTTPTQTIEPAQDTPTKKHWWSKWRHNITLGN